MKQFQPAIKWSGSKRSLGAEIIKYFPDNFGIYYEPFCGGCSVLRYLLESEKKAKGYVCSDVNQDLINLWKDIMNCPEKVALHYRYLWEGLLKASNKKGYYEEIRKRFNDEHNHLDFLFINRTCYNGLIRYNKSGAFNSPFHLNRDGIKPDKLSAIINEWSLLLNTNNVVFKCCSYDEIMPEKSDFVYLDPPYANTKGMYEGGFDSKLFFNWLSQVQCKWALSYNGYSGNERHICDIPFLYKNHLLIKSGNSSFKRLINNNKPAVVYESLYLN